MSRRREIAIALVSLTAITVLTSPLWGMGMAVFLDSDRTILSAQPSPDGARIAQVERVIVGGVPNIVVTVRPRWKPNWYLATCAVASHYGEARAAVTWNSDAAIRVSVADALVSWDSNKAPFQNGGCPGLSVSIAPLAR
jgi:hypothetical protein